MRTHLRVLVSDEVAVGTFKGKESVAARSRPCSSSFYHTARHMVGVREMFVVHKEVQA